MGKKLGGGGGLNAPSSEILLLLKHNNYLACMEKNYCSCYRYPDSSLSEKKDGGGGLKCTFVRDPVVVKAQQLFSLHGKKLLFLL